MVEDPPPSNATPKGTRVTGKHSQLGNGHADAMIYILAITTIK
jgi:hypothetical protein